MSITDWFRILSLGSPLFGLVTGFRKRYSLLWLYLFTDFILDITQTILKKTHHPTACASSLFVILEFIIISLIYHNRIFKGKALFYMVAGLTGVSFIASTLYDDLLHFNMKAACMPLFVFICYAIFGLYTIMNEDKSLYLEKSWFFWFNIAMLLYASGAFFLFLFKENLIASDRNRFLQMWTLIFMSLNITKNLLLAVSIHYYKRMKE